MVVKAAVVQAEPEWLDLQASVQKTCRFIGDAASHGAQIIAFPELWVPGYPGWIWSRPMDPVLNVEFVKNSLVVDSPEMDVIRKCAAENEMVVCLGFSERSGGTVYIAQSTINSDGSLLVARRKLKPIHMERTVFGDGHGPSLCNVAQTPVGRVGALSCGEHYNPLLKYHTFAQGEEIHVAAWPPVMPHPGGKHSYSMSQEAVEAASRVYSMESQAFTLHSTTVISTKGVEKLGTAHGMVFNTPGGGASAIFGPDGRKLTNNLPLTEEGIVYATLDFDDQIKEKGLLDCCGHCSRPDLLWLVSNTEEQKSVRSA
ncbi:hypothetical protein ASPVEDRAFT_195809 [Aspergillus versicolor CBS 583.65]|uniref:nitrilase n=1 Tax=Aspergillus versicolor CBS 583.65 TaxID=1036611 RepID=A0A1L9PQW6_ASPVE|nr:uncharacterized protein ASPVEDRAFT_195809 [Aspergillus versicolor CBS 583.65]OJJ03924.1 hypothetical protein ASPVEDRAFT_195809 [Aspergillus versicolor CBS 583.65]